VLKCSFLLLGLILGLLPPPLLTGAMGVVVGRDLGRGGIGIFGGVLLLVLLLAICQLWPDMMMRHLSEMLNRLGGKRIRCG